MAFIYSLAKDILIYFWSIIKAVKKFNFVQFIKISGYFSNSICGEKNRQLPGRHVVTEKGRILDPSHLM